MATFPVPPMAAPATTVTSPAVPFTCNVPSVTQKSAVVSPEVSATVPGPSLTTSPSTKAHPNAPALST